MPHSQPDFPLLGFGLLHWLLEYTSCMWMRRVDEVQRALVLLHLLGYEVLQPLKILKCLLLCPWQVFYQWIEHLTELSVWKEGRGRT